MNTWCVWESGQVCEAYDLPQFIKERGAPYLEFSLGITLPYEAEYALVQLIAAQIARNLFS